MNPHHGREVARPQEPVMPAILAGRSWIARHVRNNCHRQHCHMLVRAFQKGAHEKLRELCARLLGVLESRGRVLFDLHPNDLAVVPAILRVCAYSDQWLRQPEDWFPQAGADAGAQWAHLLRHLLARYAVPGFLDQAWKVNGPFLHFERDCWCAIGQGRALRKESGFPSSVSNRVLHMALARGGSTSLSEAVWQVQLQQLGASATLQAAVMGSRVPLEFSHHREWVRLVAKFTAGTDKTDKQFSLVANALVVAQEHHGPAQVERLLGLPLGDLIRYSIKFVARLMEAKGHLLTDLQVMQAAKRADMSRLAATTWKPMFGEEIFKCKNGHAHGFATWRIVEICSIADLKAEGVAMRHCVAGYARRCREGSSAIFSLRHHRLDGDKTIVVTSYATMEVNPSTQRVVQIRANGNRLPNNTCMVLINEWALSRKLR